MENNEYVRPTAKERLVRLRAEGIGNETGYEKKSDFELLIDVIDTMADAIEDLKSRIP
jgi:hypothetical protein